MDARLSQSSCEELPSCVTRLHVPFNECVLAWLCGSNPKSHLSLGPVQSAASDRGSRLKLFGKVIDKTL